jgi:hypothetical protein
MHKKTVKMIFINDSMPDEHLGQTAVFKRLVGEDFHNDLGNADIFSHVPDEGA